MNEADRIDGLKAISKTHRDQFRERRLIEWKCVFTTISFFVLFVAAVLKGDISLDWPLKLVFSLGSAVLVIISGMYLAYLHMAGNKDKELAEKAEDALRLILEQPEQQQVPPLLGFEKYWVSWNTFSRAKGGRWGYIWQTLTVFFFAAVSILIIWFKS